MRSLPAWLPDTDRRTVLRVATQPFVRVDRNDYSIDRAFAGRRVEIRVSQRNDQVPAGSCTGTAAAATRCSTNQSRAAPDEISNPRPA